MFGAVFTKLGASDLIANTLLNVPLPDTERYTLVWESKVRRRRHTTAA